MDERVLDWLEKSWPILALCNQCCAWWMWATLLLDPPRSLFWRTVLLLAGYALLVVTSRLKVFFLLQDTSG